MRDRVGYWYFVLNKNDISSSQCHLYMYSLISIQYIQSNTLFDFQLITLGILINENKIPFGITKQMYVYLDYNYVDGSMHVGF